MTTISSSSSVSTVKAVFEALQRYKGTCPHLMLVVEKRSQLSEAQLLQFNSSPAKCTFFFVEDWHVAFFFGKNTCLGFNHRFSKCTIANCQREHACFLCGSTKHGATSERCKYGRSIVSELARLHNESGVRLTPDDLSSIGAYRRQQRRPCSKKQSKPSVAISRVTTTRGRSEPKQQPKQQQPKLPHKQPHDATPCDSKNAPTFSFFSHQPVFVQPTAPHNPTGPAWNSFHRHPLSWMVRKTVHETPQHSAQCELPVGPGDFHHVWGEQGGFQIPL